MFEIVSPPPEEVGHTAGTLAGAPAQAVVHPRPPDVIGGNALTTANSPGIRKVAVETVLDRGYWEAWNMNWWLVGIIVVVLVVLLVIRKRQQSG